MPNHGFHILDFSALNVIYFSTDVCRHLFEFIGSLLLYLIKYKTRVRKHTLRNLPNAILLELNGRFSLVSPIITSKVLLLVLTLEKERSEMGGDGVEPPES